MVSQNFKILFFIVLTPTLAKKVKLGPHWHHSERTSCEEFGQHARFNPDAVTNESWFIFYYWAPQPQFFYLRFEKPTNYEYSFLHKNLNGHVTVTVNWTARHLMLIMDVDLFFLVEQGDRGQYLMYNVKNAWNLSRGERMEPVDVRLKQTGDNKIIGMMVCKKETVYAMVRTKELPRQYQLQDWAARLNYRSRGGRSYLYQEIPTGIIDYKGRQRDGVLLKMTEAVFFGRSGNTLINCCPVRFTSSTNAVERQVLRPRYYLYQGHHWMPIPEQDDMEYWKEAEEHAMRGDKR